MPELNNSHVSDTTTTISSFSALPLPIVNDKSVDAIFHSAIISQPAAVSHPATESHIVASTEIAILIFPIAARLLIHLDLDQRRICWPTTSQQTVTM